MVKKQQSNNELKKKIILNSFNMLKVNEKFI